jgi:hypothetical protein
MLTGGVDFSRSKLENGGSAKIAAWIFALYKPGPQRATMCLVRLALL